MIVCCVGACTRAKSRQDGYDAISSRQNGNHENNQNGNDENNYLYKSGASLSDVLVRRKAVSYLMAAKGLLNKVNDKVNRLDHFIQLT